MKKTFSTYILIFISYLLVFDALGQGCSDAGFCTMGAMKPAQNFAKEKNFRLRTLELTQYMGNTTFDLNVYSTIIEANFGIGKAQKDIIQIKLPYNYIVGNLGNISGLGDISLSYSRPIWKNETLQLNATLGGKIPTGDANQKSNQGKPLPMYYQTTLGTYDLVGGLSLVGKDWMLATGFQVPIINTTNKNEFRWGAWANTEQSLYVRNYPVSWNLQRGSDIMLRAEKNFRFSRLSFHTGFLFIYHLIPDKITSTQTLEETEVELNKGLIINLINTFEYKLSVENGLRFVWGYKLRNNEKNPSGLSREYVLTLTYFQNF
jgi:hypothetical protein